MNGGIMVVMKNDVSSDVSLKFRISKRYASSKLKYVFLNKHHVKALSVSFLSVRNNEFLDDNISELR